MKNRSLYVHIPFCEKRCRYCHFVSSLEMGLQGKYLDALEEDMRGEHRLEESHITTIYVGGGTPSLLEPEYRRRLLSLLRPYHREGAEWTVEVNPESVTRELLEDYVAAGVNRISMGVQSMNDEQLQVLGRIHDQRRVKDAVKMIREAGIQNLNLDLIYNYDDQHLLEKSLRGILALEPEHISIYELELEENLSDLRVLDSDESYEQFHLLDRELTKSGYKRYEVSNYAKPGYESRHNSRYWSGDEYFGFGLSASSLLEGTRMKRTSHMATYLASPSTLEESEALTEDDLAFEVWLLGLRTSKGVHEASFLRDFSNHAWMMDVIHDHLERGNLHREEGYIRATEQGFDLLHQILVDLI